MREKRRVFEKFSEPAESAGRGAFLIAGYWRATRVSPVVCLCSSASTAVSLQQLRQGGRVSTYRSCSYAALFEFLKGGRGGLGSLDEFKLGLAAVDAVRLRHCGGNVTKANSCWEGTTNPLYVDVDGRRGGRREEWTRRGDRKEISLAITLVGNTLFWLRPLQLLAGAFVGVRDRKLVFYWFLGTDWGAWPGDRTPGAVPARLSPQYRPLGTATGLTRQLQINMGT